MKEENIIKIQKAWSIINNTIGYTLIAVLIVLGVQKGYYGTAYFSVFCWAAGVYFFSKYIYYPLFLNKKDVYELSRYKNLGVHFEEFTSVLGNGNVLFGRFGSKLNLPHQRTDCYSFLSIMYIPLIPTGRYRFMCNRKQIQIDSFSTKKVDDPSSAYKGSMDAYQCWVFKRFDWAEVLYIYLKNWSFAVMVITVLDTFINDYFKQLY